MTGQGQQAQSLSHVTAPHSMVCPFTHNLYKGRHLQDIHLFLLPLLRPFAKWASRCSSGPAACG